jgi:hypothetical protein
MFILTYAHKKYQCYVKYKYHMPFLCPIPTTAYSQGVQYEVVSESSQSVLVVIPSLKEDEKGGGHTSASLIHHSTT